MKDRNKPDLHLFTTNHPYFIELGLSSFTTGTLIEWWNQRTADGRWLNRRHINFVPDAKEPLADPPNGLNKLLGMNNTTDFIWYGWKPNVNIENAGRFKKQNLYGMLGQGGTQEDQWEYRGATSHNMNDINATAFQFAVANPMIGASFDGTIVSPMIADNLSTYWEPLKTLNPIYSLIQLNKYINHFDDYFPRATWDRNDPPGGWQANELFGIWSLLSEIRSAKGNPAIQWSGDITFLVSEGGILNQCPITAENVQFTLYLTDESMTSVDNKAVTVKNMTIVGPKRDALGASPAEDGERGGVDDSNPANQTAGELELQWNPVTKKYQSGNVNMLAKLVTDVPPGKVPNLNYLLSSDIKEMLDDENNTYSYIPGRGSGMPIRTQNSMPLQWSPNYAQTKDVRCNTDSKEKLLVPVYNFNPRKFYPSGEEVLLTQIDDLWHISDLGKGDVGPSGGPDATGIGKWGSFSYLMTSSEFFFKGLDYQTNKPVSVTPRDAELNFHKRFYSSSAIDQEDRAFNGATNYGPEGNVTLDIKPIGGYNFSQPFDTTTHKVWYDLRGWLQTTSFDFLDSQIFGIRGKGGLPDKCSISSTSATINSAGNVIPFDPTEYPNRNAAHTGTFFGCVFPEGYEGTQIYDDQERNQKFLVNSHAFRTDKNNYFTIPQQQANPFENNQNRSTSNVKCRATARDTKDPPTDKPELEGGSNLWERGSTKKDANMFFIDAKGGRRTVPADVMLNASPKGQHGSPIKPLEAFRDMFTKDFDVASHGYAAKALECGAWLYQQPTNAPEDIYKSAFDFKPVRTDNIMFRPLKLEGYLGASHIDPSIGQLLALEDYSKSMRVFYAEANRTQTDFTSPMSKHVTRTRELQNCKDNLVGGINGVRDQIDGTLLSDDYLKWGAWTSEKPAYNSLHRWSYWDTDTEQGALYWVNLPRYFLNYEQYEQYPSNWVGAGAFGIITTSQTVKANSRISFTTQNLYGMGAGANGTFTLAGQTQDRTWGVGNFVDSYKQNNIIDLSVRIYQGHPPHLTLYDPRYFAVHHFNEGPAYLNDKYYGVAGAIPVNALGLSLGKVRNYVQENFKTIRDGNGTLLSNVYYNYAEASGVDIRIPSIYAKHLDFRVNPQECHAENEVYQPVSLNIYDKVFANGTQRGSTLMPQLMAEKYWNVDTRRTGKLLPYQYFTKTLGVPSPDGSYITLVSEADVKGQSVLLHSDKLIVKNFGKNYVANESAVGILNNSIVLKVTETGDGGSIKKLQVMSAGTGIPLNFVRPTGDKIGEFSSLFRMQSIAGAGDGFDGYFLCTAIQKVLACDPKPFLIKSAGKEIVRIAANEPGPRHPTFGLSSSAEPDSFVNKTEATSFEIPPILKSADNSYDIFFHFHNDISMTWLACGSRTNNQPAGNFNNITECNEQHVTIEAINLV